MLRVFRYSNKDFLYFKDIHIQYITIPRGADILTEYILQPTPKIPGTALSIYLDNYVIIHHDKYIMKTVGCNVEKEVTQEDVMKALHGFFDTRDINVNAFYQSQEDLELLQSICQTDRVNFVKYPPIGIDPEVFEFNGKLEFHNKRALMEASKDSLVYYYVLMGVPRVSTVFDYKKDMIASKITAKPNAYYDISYMFKNPGDLLAGHRLHTKLYDERVLPERSDAAPYTYF